MRYEIVPSELEAFERFAKRSITLVNRHGGDHHGYFMPSEGASGACPTRRRAAAAPAEAAAKGT